MVPLASRRAAGPIATIVGAVLRAPRATLVMATLGVIVAAIFGVPVITLLPAGGFHDPDSESQLAATILADKFDRGTMQLFVTVHDDDGVASEAARSVGAELVSELAELPFVASVESTWTVPPDVAATMTSEDGTTGLVVAGVNGTEREITEYGLLLEHLMVGRDGVTVAAGGPVMSFLQANQQSEEDLLRMELIAFPLTFVVLLWVFGGLVAAALPVAVGAVSILGSLAILRILNQFTDVSLFALNLTMALGLALAVDYTLLIISRHREEVAAGRTVDDAIAITMATAGRTVFFSAITVALAMATMLLFPLYFLKSFAYAGVAVVLLAALASLVITPAAIVLLGNRLDGLDVVGAVRRRLGRQPRSAAPTERTLLYRGAVLVMRRAVPVGVAVTALLVLLGLPFAGVNWGYADDRVLTQAHSSRQVGDELRTGFAMNGLADVYVVLPNAADAGPAALGHYAAELSRVADVASVSAPDATYRDGAPVGPPSGGAELITGSAYFTVRSSAPLYTNASADQLDALHAVATPGGGSALMTGNAQISRDSAEAITTRLPLVLAVIALITVLLLFLMTGSVLLPLKALVLTALSLCASFGALVWVFQEGHLGGFGTTVTGTLMASVPVLLFCVAFGLAMDYELFLVSRMREFWLESTQTREASDRAVALGLARTGRVVTAAALLMIVSFAALTSAEVSFMRMLGVGLALAVLVDATLVRMVLVPASMHLLGTLNWWAPPALRRLHDRFGISEGPNAESERAQRAATSATQGMAMTPSA